MSVLEYRICLGIVVLVSTYCFRRLHLGLTTPAVGAVFITGVVLLFLKVLLLWPVYYIATGHPPNEDPFTVCFLHTWLWSATVVFSALALHANHKIKAARRRGEALDVFDIWGGSGIN
jgi:hypothetical protein